MIARLFRAIRAWINPPLVESREKTAQEKEAERWEGVFRNYWSGGRK